MLDVSRSIFASGIDFEWPSMRHTAKLIGQKANVLNQFQAGFSVYNCRKCFMHWQSVTEQIMVAHLWLFIC